MGRRKEGQGAEKVGDGVVWLTGVGWRESEAEERGGAGR